MWLWGFLFSLNLPGKTKWVLQRRSLCCLVWFMVNMYAKYIKGLSRWRHLKCDISPSFVCVVHLLITYCWSKQEKADAQSFECPRNFNLFTLPGIHALVITELFLQSTNYTWLCLGPSTKSMTYNSLSLITGLFKKVPHLYYEVSAPRKYLAVINLLFEGFSWKLVTCWGE
jgi:hypothetical protein